MKYIGIILFTFFVFAVQPALAEKYVSDVLWVSIRDAASDSAKTVKVIKSGTRLEILDQNEVEGYLHVRTSGGEEGWVSSRYLLDEPVSALRVSQLEKQLEAIAKENQSLKEMTSGMTALDDKEVDKETDRELKRVLSENQQLLKDNQQLTTEIESLKTSLADPAKLVEENETLKNENLRLKTEYQSVKSKFDNVTGDTERTWFMTGAGVLFAGIILGLIFPSLRFRRRSSWS